MTISRTYSTPLAVRHGAISGADSNALAQYDARKIKPTGAKKPTQRIAEFVISAGLLSRHFTENERLNSEDEDALDLALQGTFPASDPVSVTFRPNLPSFPLSK